MIDTNFEGLEALRVMRCGGDLTISGADAPAITIHSNVAPESRRLDGALELVLPAGGALEIPRAVVVEVLDCAGHLSARDLAVPLSLGRVRGHLTLRGVKSVAIRGKVGGHLLVHGAGALEGEQLSGSLEVDGADSVRLSHVAGNAELHALSGELTLDSVGGRLSLRAIRGAAAVHSVGGKLEAEDIAALDVGNVGGKLKAVAGGQIRAGRVGGRLSVDGAASVSVQSVGGHVNLAGVTGDIDLPQAGGAVDLAGPLPSSGTWRVLSRGRISLETGPEDSFELEASAGWGRIRLHGIDDRALSFTGRNRIAGRVGAGAGGLKVSLNTRHADVIIAGFEARDYDCRRKERQFSRRFAASFENLAEEIGDNIPGLLDELLGQIGSLVAHNSPLSGGYMKDFAQELKHGLGGALRDLERTFDELGERIPDDVTQHLKRFGNHLRDLGREAGGHRGFSDEAREEMREKIHAAVREMREAIVRATREARAPSHAGEKAHDSQGGAANQPSGADRARSGDTAGRAASASQAPQPEAAPSSGPRDAPPRRSHDRDIMAILQAVREGKLEVAEADDLIAAWIEVKRDEPHKDS